MKKIPIYFLLVALLAALTGCGGSETPAQTPTESTPPPAVETQGAIPGDIDAARAAYAALSESDQQLFLEEIAAGQKARQVARLEALQGQLYGEWRMEYNYSGPHYALKLVLNEDMTFEYGKFAGTWHFTEDGEIALVNGEDGVTYFFFSTVEEDGFLKLLCEGDYLYVRSDEYKEAYGKKFVEVRFSQLEDYLGPLQYVGSVPHGVWDGPVGDCYIFDSLAYDQGLIYVGRSTSDVEIELTLRYPDGTEYTTRMYTPFDLQFLDEPYTATDFFVGKGALVFVREEYVEEMTVVDNEYREIRLKSGNALWDYNFVGWNVLPDGLYENFQY